MPARSDVLDLNATSWTLTGLPERRLHHGAPATLNFEAGRAYGTDGCNRYTTTYELDASKLRIGPNVASTRMACTPDVMAQAQEFMSALTRTRGHRIVGSRLELLSADGEVVATLAAQSQELAGTSWRVVGYNNGRQAVVSTLNGTELTMEFSADGRVTGSAGCNCYTAGYSQEGSRLAITRAAATRRMCASPEGVMEQEQRFLKALEMVATARVEADRLGLRTVDGALAVTLER